MCFKIARRLNKLEKLGLFVCKVEIICKYKYLKSN